MWSNQADITCLLNNLCSASQAIYLINGSNLVLNLQQRIKPVEFRSAIMFKYVYQNPTEPDLMQPISTCIHNITIKLSPKSIKVAPKFTIAHTKSIMQRE